MEITLKYKNLLFRRPTHNDIDELLILKNNKVASKLLGGNTPSYTFEDLAKWVDFHNNNQEEILLVIYDVIADKLIGHVGLYKIDNTTKKAEYGILLADDNSRGKGYGTMCTKTMIDFAFDVLCLHKVYAEIIDENISSVTMFKKCGFKIDGVLRDDNFKNGHYCDVLTMSILENERTNG
nr:GNAT family protein [uncultured Prevotella sp.]